MAAIETQGLTKRYGRLVAVEDLDLVVERGEVFGILGPNGSGKTTTILMLLGLTVLTSTMWGIVGVGLVAVALGVLALAVARFGRR